MSPSTFMPWFSWCPWAYVFFFMCCSLKIDDLVVDQTRMDRSLCGWSLHIMLFFTLFFKNQFSSIWIDNEKKNPVRMHFGSLISLFYLVRSSLPACVCIFKVCLLWFRKKGKRIFELCENTTAVPCQPLLKLWRVNFSKGPAGSE